MKLWMSGEIQLDIADAYRQVTKTVETEVNRLLAAVSIPGKIDGWDFIAIIREEDDADFDEVATKSGHGKELEFRLKIPHAEFLSASPTQRVGLVFGALSRSIVLMDKLGVSADAQETLQGILTEAQNNLGVLH